MRLVHVDAFAWQPFAGNPAAVCLFPPGEDERWMQGLACELRQPMTAFVQRDGKGSGLRLRWFNVCLAGQAVTLITGELTREALSAEGQGLAGAGSAQAVRPR